MRQQLLLGRPELPFFDFKDIGAEISFLKLPEDFNGKLFAPGYILHHSFDIRSSQPRVMIHQDEMIRILELVSSRFKHMPDIINVGERFFDVLGQLQLGNQNTGETQLV